MGEAVRAEYLGRPGDQFHGTLDSLEAGFLEELGVEERAEDGTDVAVGLDEGLAQGVDGVGVPRWDGVPSGYLYLVSDEEIVEQPGDEARGCRLLDDHVDDVLAVEVAGVAEVGLYAVVVIVFAIDEP